MAKRKSAASKLGRKLKRAFNWLPSEEKAPLIASTHQFGPHCHTIIHYRLHVLADKILRDDGFYAERTEMRAWLAEPENAAWVQAANPHAITSDGHLSAAAAFC